MGKQGGIVQAGSLEPSPTDGAKLRAEYFDELSARTRVDRIPRGEPRGFVIGVCLERRIDRPIESSPKSSQQLLVLPPGILNIGGSQRATRPEEPGRTPGSDKVRE